MTNQSSRPVVSLHRLAWVLSLVVLFSLGGCKDLAGTQVLPAGIQNPSYYNNASGALEMRNAAVSAFEQMLPEYIIDAGLLTDELEDVSTGVSTSLKAHAGYQVFNPLDERILPVGVSVASYSDLQAVRTYSNQALGALAMYDTAVTAKDSARVLRGELYALEGYAEVLLADLFCSGVPLSTLDYGQDFTYSAGDSTAQIYRDAIGKFDTALTIASSSDSVVHLAQVGRGRAFLDLGQYDSAAAAVITVPDVFQYQVGTIWINKFHPYGGTEIVVGPYVAMGSGSFVVSASGNSVQMSDREGQNGLPYRSNGDPRTATVSIGFNASTNDSSYFPVIYSAALISSSAASSYAPYTLASGVEARLVEAEVALHAGSATWLSLLAQARQDLPANQTGAGMAPLVDPMTDTGRIRLLFTERAYDLFATGHRQGDLRRLLRLYATYSAFNTPQKVYPTGSYLGFGEQTYGTAVVVPVPPSESANPKFHGCFSYAP